MAKNSNSSWEVLGNTYEKIQGLDIKGRDAHTYRQLINQMRAINLKDRTSFIETLTGFVEDEFGSNISPEFNDAMKPVLQYATAIGVWDDFYYSREDALKKKVVPAQDEDSLENSDEASYEESSCESEIDESAVDAFAERVKKDREKRKVKCMIL